MSDEPVLRIYICGRLAVERGQALIQEGAFPARQGRRLWSYLVLNRRRPVGREELADAIWGDKMPDTWDATLNALASRLRSLLRPISSAHGDLGIQGEVGRYVLKLPMNVFIDLERARKAIHEADIAMHRRDLQVALNEARVAMEIAARGFMPGDEAPWIERQRRSLLDVQTRALERTVEAELYRGRPDVAEHEARLLLALDPLRESAYRLLMRSLAACGNRGEVVRAMEECRRALWESGVSAPSGETERVFRELTDR